MPVEKRKKVLVHRTLILNLKRDVKRKPQCFQIVLQQQKYQQMEIVIRCKDKSKVHNKENQRNNNQYSSLNFTDKQNSFSHVFRELPISTSQNYSSINSSVLSKNDEELLLNSLESLELNHKEESNNEAFLSTYGESIRAESMNEKPTGMFLNNHKIDASLRARMLDWMTEVTCSYKFEAKTYFDGVQFLDKYLQFKRQSVEPTELHALGVVAMLVASKIHEVFPLRIGMVYEKIGHRKISMNKLITVEADIMNTLEYKLNEWTFFDIASVSISALNDEFVLKVLAYVCRFVVIEYEFYCKMKPSLIGEACAWVVLHIFNKKESTWMNNIFEVQDCGRKVLSLIRGFKSVHTSIRNLDRFTDEKVIEKVSSFMESSKNYFI